MRKPHLSFSAGLITIALFTSMALTSCTARVGVGYRVYDPYYGDYHVWSGPEVDYYNQWTVETHRPHRDFRKLSRADKKAYFTWRHSHEHPEHH